MKLSSKARYSLPRKEREEGAQCQSSSHTDTQGTTEVQPIANTWSLAQRCHPTQYATPTIHSQEQHANKWHTVDYRIIRPTTVDCIFWRYEKIINSLFSFTYGHTSRLVLCYIIIIICNRFCRLYAWMSQWKHLQGVYSPGLLRHRTKHRLFEVQTSMLENIKCMTVNSENSTMWSDKN